jgi:glutaredoxin
MKVVLFSKDPCPACDSVKAKLAKAGLEVEEVVDNGRMYHLVQALPDVRSVPVVLAYGIGDGATTTELIQRVA